MTSALLALLIAAPLGAQDLISTSERSAWLKTGRYAEAVSLCEGFQGRYTGRARCERFGTTPEGRPLVVLIASDDGALSPESAREKGRPVVLLQGGIHAGEIDGKDAGFWLLRDLLDGKALPGVLSRLTVLFIPVLNADGHERFGPNHRPNQRGPEEMGWRVNARNLNLNRDYAKAEAPEIQDALRLLAKWDPILYVDLHTTDGAKFQHSVSLVAKPLQTGPERLRPHVQAMLERLEKSLSPEHKATFGFYPEFNVVDRPDSGFGAYWAPPKLQIAYWPLRNRIAVLVETHAWKTHGERVKASRDVAAGLLEAAAADGKEWLTAAAESDEADRRGELEELPLIYARSPSSRPLELHGYEYTIAPSDISGQSWIRYDDSKPTVSTVPYFHELTPTLTARLPKAGYLVPAAWAPLVGEKLALHGLAFETLKDAKTVEVAVFRASTTLFSPAPFEGRHILQLWGEWGRERRELPAGSLFVPLNQRGARLLAFLLEPQSLDSLAWWGFFNSAFEQKESMENYIAEQVAREMLAKDKKLTAEFERKLKEEPAFAADYGQRLMFFYRRHPSWDERMSLYPVYRAERRP